MINQETVSDWCVSEKEFTIYMCVSCMVEVSKSAYEADPSTKHGHEHYKVIVDRETGLRKWHPYYLYNKIRMSRIARLRGQVEPIGQCSKNEQGYTIDPVYMCGANSGQTHKNKK